MIEFVFPLSSVFVVPESIEVDSPLASVSVFLNLSFHYPDIYRICYPDIYRICYPGIYRIRYPGIYRIRSPGIYRNRHPGRLLAGIQCT
ncbi:MAG: hypothetical protein H8E21_06040 [Gammaproteobacteria bacterium]|nr:hypothetical protein [Gammaproteobacteria bacterium]MBL6999657.1 hypothetical protein [Gammaproteobacteria bacterium]